MGSAPGKTMSAPWGAVTEGESAGQTACWRARDYKETMAAAQAERQARDFLDFTDIYWGHAGSAACALLSK